MPVNGDSLVESACVDELHLVERGVTPGRRDNFLFLSGLYHLVLKVLLFSEMAQFAQVHVGVLE